jgi:hypothetical protein
VRSASLPWGVAVIDRSCPQVANQGKDDAPGNSEDRAVTHRGHKPQSPQGVDDRREGLVLGEPAYPNRHRVRADGGTLPGVLSTVIVRVRTVCVNQVFFSARSALAISRGASTLSERQLLLTRTTTRNLVIRP